MNKLYLLVVAMALVVGGASVASAGVIGDDFDLTFKHGLYGPANVVLSSTSADPLVVQQDKSVAAGMLDDPMWQEWMVLNAASSSVRDGIVRLEFQLTYSDASEFEASKEFSLSSWGLDDDGVAMEIVGDIELWFSPQMSSASPVTLVEGVHWSQNQSDGLVYQIGNDPGTAGSLATLVPEQLAPVGAFSGDARVRNIHWAFDARPVPEPATMALLTIGAIQALRRRRY